VIELGNRANWAPAGGRVAVLAGNSHWTVGIAGGLCLSGSMRPSRWNGQGEGPRGCGRDGE